MEVSSSSLDNGLKNHRYWCDPNCLHQNYPSVSQWQEESRLERESYVFESHQMDQKLRVRIMVSPIGSDPIRESSNLSLSTILNVGCGVTETRQVVILKSTVRSPCIRPKFHMEIVQLVSTSVSKTDN